ncbi:CaiB/BaiF CoA-transferase family protein [Cupriavidus sp. UME77]|uniref:CaiB/BaiF CoA transferase family protein n=1 Tax=Cupriavidus sp. UME77 TaxID=1862321 RepID=UPI0016048934|nr:CaiB/BaiF CoA-transferase family protein [Cupriavidus sp. UME77]MBB1634924.1 carnitine dehydratase [Cupriavidus sp. UME77]
MAGPLTGVTVLELAGMGPGPFCAMMLADMGADVLRVQRPTAGAAKSPTNPVVGRGMRSIELDLKTEAGRQAVQRLAAQSDVLIEGFRPGVMERLGLGPDVCLERNPRLVYGRMTGWGQNGPLAQSAGHDINYIALTGALAAIGTQDSGPIPPLNIVGDFGGGGMLLAFGIACALFEAIKSGKGQVVDAAMTDGSAMLMATTFGYYAAGMWKPERGSNLLDGAAPFYTTYRCADGKWVAVGAIEPQFYAALLQRLELDQAEFEPQHDRRHWPQWCERLAQLFATRTRDEWCARMEGADACFTPVLDMREAPSHPHNMARNTFVEREGAMQPAPAPRFSRTAPELRPRGEESMAAILTGFGFSDAEIAQLAAGAR